MKCSAKKQILSIVHNAIYWAMKSVYAKMWGYRQIVWHEPPLRWMASAIELYWLIFLFSLVNKLNINDKWLQQGVSTCYTASFILLHDFLWGCVKQLVYSDKLPTHGSTHWRSIFTIDAIRSDLLKIVVKKIDWSNGSYIPQPRKSYLENKMP